MGAIPNVRLPPRVLRADGLTLHPFWIQKALQAAARRREGLFARLMAAPLPPRRKRGDPRNLERIAAIIPRLVPPRTPARRFVAWWRGWWGPR